MSETLKDFSGEQLEEIFKEIGERDRFLPAAIAARTALRIVPFLATESGFEYWRSAPYSSKKDRGPHSSVTGGSLEEDNRSRHLLTVLWCNRWLSSMGDTMDMSPRNTTADVDPAAIRAAIRAAAYADADAAAYAAAYAAVRAVRAVVDVYRANAVSATNVYNAAATAAVATYVVGTKLKEEVAADIATANANTSLNDLMQMPLWRDSVPGWAKNSFDRFKHAVNALAAETPEQEIEQALRHFVQWYGSFSGLEAANSNTEPPSHPTAEVSADQAHGKDALNRERLVKALADVIANPNNREPLTVGLLGHWGTGKSKLVYLLKEKMRSEQVLFGEFNAWSYEHSDNIQAAMGHEIVTALTNYPVLMPADETEGYAYRLKRLLGWTLTRRLWLAGGFAVRKYPFRILLLVFLIVLAVVVGVEGFSISLEKDASLWLRSGTIGAIVFCLYGVYRQLRVLFAQSFTKELLTYVKLPSYAEHIGLVSEMRKDIKLMCKLRLSDDKRLIFVVDDLDRCGPDGIVKTFEAVRLILDIKQVIVIIAIDQRIALAVLALHYDELTPHHEFKNAKSIARDYLGKMIQLPIALPPLALGDVVSYAQHLWSSDSDLRWFENLGIDNPDKATSEDDPEAEISEADGEGDQQKLSATELARRLLDFKQPKPPEQKTLIGLSDLQKAAFVHWSDQLGLTNPRQLKRLYNSYNLLLRVTGWDDEALESPEKLPLGLLIALLILEFVNSQTDCALRATYRAVVYGDKPGTALDGKPMSQILATVLPILDQAARKYVSNPAGQRKRLLDTVSCFVLPAIDEIEDEGGEQEKKIMVP